MLSKRVPAVLVGGTLVGCLCAGCGSYYGSEKGHTATFSGAQTFGEASKPVALDVIMVGGPQRNEETAKQIKKLCDHLREIPPANQALMMVDCGVVATHVNEVGTAQDLLDQAIPLISATHVDPKILKRVTSLTGAESAKPFKGEPHERVIVFLYRGLLYLAEGDFENANACFQTASLQDALAEKSQDRGDWLVADLLQLLCKRKMDPSSAREFAGFIRSRYGDDMIGADQTEGPVEGTVVVVAFTGPSPEKRTAKDKKKQQSLVYFEKPSLVGKVTVGSGSRQIDLKQSDDIFVQAVTRGRRKMDEVLAYKAKVQKMVEAGSIGVLTGAQLAAQVAPVVGIGGAGLLGMIAFEVSMRGTSKINTAADVRTLQCVPGKIYIGIFKRGSFQDQMTIQAHAADGKVLGEAKVQLPKPQDAIEPGGKRRNAVSVIIGDMRF